MARNSKLNFLSTFSVSKFLSSVQATVNVCKSSKGNEYLFDADNNELLGAVSGGYANIQDNCLVSRVEGKNGEFWLMHKAPQRTVIATLSL